MDFLGAVLLAAAFVGVSLLRRGTRLPGRVILANPVTVWFTPSVLMAAGVSVLVLWIGFELDRPLYATLIAGFAAFTILRAGRVFTPSRIVYDRGGIAFTPAAVAGALGAFALMVYLLAFA